MEETRLQSEVAITNCLKKETLSKAPIESKNYILYQSTKIFKKQKRNSKQS